MTEAELRALYTEAVKIVRAERKMRQYVFRSNAEKLEEKLAEIDRLAAILAQMKDALKEQMGRQQEQMALLPPPVRYE